MLRWRAGLSGLCSGVLLYCVVRAQALPSTVLWLSVTVIGAVVIAAQLYRWTAQRYNTARTDATGIRGRS